MTLINRLKKNRAIWLWTLLAIVSCLLTLWLSYSSEYWKYAPVSIITTAFVLLELVKLLGQMLGSYEEKNPKTWTRALTFPLKIFGTLCIFFATAVISYMSLQLASEITDRGILPKINDKFNEPWEVVWFGSAEILLNVGTDKKISDGSRNMEEDELKIYLVIMALCWCFQLVYISSVAQGFGTDRKE